MHNPDAINIHNGQLRYLDSDHAVIANLEMSFPTNSWSCILGKSGCGKTSLLRYLAGLLNDSALWSGEVHYASDHLKDQVAYMAQQDLLMPWLNVLDNVCFSIRLSGRSRSEQETQAALELIHAVGLAEHVDKLPQQLSGGMRQRVALARTLMQDKPIVLMDEPFSALDAVTRYKLQNLASKLLINKTVLLITHDPQEALRLGEQIYIMQGAPASAIKLTAPETEPPREFNSELATLHQNILTILEQDYV